MRILFCIMILSVICSVACATPYTFNGVMVDVEDWTGAGNYETILVIDWNRIDLGTATIHESHAFGYRWDGDKTEYDMLMDFDSAGIFDVSYAGYLLNITYNDSQEVHSHIELGSWNAASTTDPYAYWGIWGDSEWDWNAGGMEQEYLANGQFEGINAVMFFDDLPAYADTQLNIPIMPEPATIGLLTTGWFFVRRNIKYIKK